MSDKSPQQSLVRHRVGELPLLQAVARKIRCRDVLARHLASHGNADVETVDKAMLLIFNIARGRQPLYELEDWVGALDPKLFTFDIHGRGLNDDGFARVLDRIHDMDRASVMTEIVLAMITATKLDLGQLNNDSTTLKAFGKIPGRTKTGLFLARGKSKDHRPDLKQLVYCLTVSADGAVPVHFKTYPGNRTDDTTHIETWETLRKIAGTSDFLYVADCKACTDRQLSHITGRGLWRR